MPTPQLATQKFTLIDCREGADIKFQLGILSQKQIDSFKNINQTIAMAYREYYDSENLKGKGFIYIAPEKGLLKPASPDFREDAWSRTQGNRVSSLLATLIHELGYVFGLQDDHITYDYNELMGASFVEKVTSKKYSSSFSLGNSAPLGLQARSDSMTAMMSNSMPKEVKELFGMSSNSTELSFRGFGETIDVLSAGKKLGTINLNSGNAVIIQENTVELIKLCLPLTQKVFQDPARIGQFYYPILKGRKSFTLANVEYEKINGDKKTLNCFFNDQLMPYFGAVINGKYAFNVLELSDRD